MKTILRIASAAALATAIFVQMHPAFAANDTRTIIGLCSKNPKCSMYEDSSGTGITINVDGHTIDCPMKNGPCTMARGSSRKMRAIVSNPNATAVEDQLERGGDQSRGGGQSTHEEKPDRPSDGGGSGGGNGGGTIF